MSNIGPDLGLPASFHNLHEATELSLISFNIFNNLVHHPVQFPDNSLWVEILNEVTIASLYTIPFSLQTIRITWQRQPYITEGTVSTAWSESSTMHCMQTVLKSHCFDYWIWAPHLNSSAQLQHYVRKSHRVFVGRISNIHCVQKKTPTHIFFQISMNYLWI